MRIIIRFPILLLILLILNPLGAFALENEANKTVTNPNITESKIVGSSPEVKAILFADEKKGLLTNFKLKIDEETSSFPRWVNVSNPTYYPKLFLNDLNDDGRKEIIIVLTTGTGSGLVEQEVHVFNNIDTNIGEIYEEKLVDNPIAIINKNVKTTLTKSEAIIKIGNEVNKINIEKYGINPKHLFPDIAFGSILKFDVIDNKLNAIVGAKISPAGGYLGDVYITYTFKDNMYQAEQIKFVLNQN